MPNPHHDLDMETLSALFDGELQGDAARFAIKRLGHDAHWRQALGDWQLVGDALRGQASIPAPIGFAARVARAVAAEPVRVAAVATTVSGVSAASQAAASVSSRRKWIGGAALAASVAMVAMFVAAPFSQDAVPAPGSATPAVTQLATTPTTTPAEVAAVTPSTPATAFPIGAAVVAVAAVPRRAAERRSRGQSQRAALRAPERQVAALAIASAPTAVAVAVHEPASHSTANPFRPPAEPASRPWPRAVMPAGPATAAFTVGYGSSTVNSPSFYPFEPRLPHATEVAPAPINADGPRP